MSILTCKALFLSLFFSYALFAQDNYRQQNQLALDAQLHYDLNTAKQHYQQVAKLELDSNDTYLAEKLQALQGLCEIAMLEQNFQIALTHHQNYQTLLNNKQPLVAKNLSTQNAKIQAICLQELGESKTALELLSKFAFGQNGYLDKDMVDYLSTLLLTKYPKRALRKMLPKVQQHIRMEDSKYGIRFYLAFFEDKIYFPQDGQRFAARLQAGQAIPEQAIAYYQRKLCNSYFYQKLMQEL